MFMTFEKIEPPEHPAAKAARKVREYHVETLEKIAGGFVFTKDGVNVNEHIKAACEANIKECDALIERADRMDPSLHAAAQAILDELGPNCEPA